VRSDQGRSEEGEGYQGRFEVDRACSAVWWVSYAITPAAYAGTRTQHRWAYCTSETRRFRDDCPRSL